MNSEYGFFGRMPGMSFLMGFFYLITGKNWDLAYPIIGWFQTLLDVFTIAIVFSIAKRLFKRLNCLQNVIIFNSFVSISIASHPYCLFFQSSFILVVTG